ncbi:MAG: DNA mobilization endonuclease VirD1/MobC family subunit [Pseudomonadota bacterium]
MTASKKKNNTIPAQPKASTGSSTKGKSNKIDPKAYKVISVRLRMAEFASFAEQTKIYGISGNLALRIAARRIAGFLETDKETQIAMRQITKRIGEIGDDIRSLHKLAMKDGSVEMSKLEEQRYAFGREFVRLDAQLQKILNVSHRRKDGQLLLAKAMD